LLGEANGMVEMTNPVNAYNYSPLYSKSSDSITPSVDGDIGANSHQPGADGPPSFELEGYELFGRNDVLHTNASAILTSTTRVLSPSSVKDSKHSNEGDDKHFMQAFLETQNTPITEEIPYSLPREKEKEKPIIKQEYQSTIPNCNTSNSDTTHHSNGRSRSGRMIKRVATMEFQDNREMKMIKLALSNSIVETKIDEAIELPQAHVFFPTLEEFAEPIKYISRYAACISNI
jgi:hypothetical protein